MHAKKHNGSSSEAELELDHELPPAEDGDEPARPKVPARPRAEEPQSELERVRAERAAYLDRAARIQAEFENFRKRSEKQQQEFKEYALAGAMTDAAADSRQPGSGAEHQGCIAGGFSRGHRAHRQAISRRAGEVRGAARAPRTGEPFDPNLHQAIQMVDTEEVDDNHVLDELQRGYKLKDRLLRPAMVRVARHPKP